jgi:hypothetical protein
MHNFPSILKVHLHIKPYRRTTLFSVGASTMLYEDKDNQKDDFSDYGEWSVQDMAIHMYNPER